jgi:LacI family transcriptional regulator
VADAVKAAAATLVAGARVAPPSVRHRLDSEGISLVDIAANFAMSDYLAPMFEQALCRSGATAWVAANDRTALSALDFLHARGIAVPQQISVIGFDDFPEAFEHNLTTVNFNMPSLVHHVLDFIIGPSVLSSPGRQPRQIQIDPVIIERGTTRARQA